MILFHFPSALLGTVSLQLERSVASLRDSFVMRGKSDLNLCASQAISTVDQSRLFTRIATLFSLQIELRKEDATFE